MKMRCEVYAILMFFVNLILLSVAGCTHVWEISTDPVALPVNEKIDLEVELCVTEALRNAKWETKFMGDTVIMPLGEALAANTEGVARALFSDVRVTADPNERSEEGADAVLLPRVISINRDKPVYGFEDQTTTVILEWSMRDRQGRIVWLGTITGEGTGPFAPGASQKKGAIRQARALMHDLFWKSYEEMSSSVEIKEFAASR